MLKGYFFPLALCISFSLSAQLKLPTLVSDGMVLQRDADIRLWGWASAGEKVQLDFNNHSYHAVTDENGKWQVVLPKMKAGGPYTLRITASNQLEIKDILLGDVWLCAGQSNMVLTMERVKEVYPADITAADYPQVRNFFIPTVADAARPRAELPPGRWIAATPRTVMDFGAVAYFFARSLYRQYKVPIGIINASVGGTPIEAWISEEGLKEFPDHLQAAARFRDTGFVNPMARAQTAANLNRNPNPKPTDKGLIASLKWFDTGYTPRGWRNITVPGYWADQGIRGLNGVVWYRKEIIVPATMAALQAKLFLGRIVDADQAYVNGVPVGNITYQYPPRRYLVPAGTLKEGKNTIVVRVTNTAGKGGFVPDKPYYLEIGGKAIDLRGEWQYKVGDVFPPFRGGGGANAPVSQQNQPTALYNAMIAPILPYAIKGICWYQGETNAGRPEEYRRLLPALINDWRNKWKQGELPFLYVQLPGHMEMQYLPSESQWAVLRESQLLSLAVPNTAMAVAIDLGEWNDIHPLRKKEVGERLALSARKLAYGEEKLVASGPLYTSSRIEGNKIILRFTNTGTGLITKDNEEPGYFAIAAADKKFVWARAVIENDTVVVWSDLVAQPLFVRYGWADNPEGANLCNKEGLPASPFRTDK